MAEFLHNRFDRKKLEEMLAQDKRERLTISFYRYVKLADVVNLRNAFYRQWSELGVLGRVYMAEEGINAQVTVPVENETKLRATLDAHEGLKNLRFNRAVQNSSRSFIKLTIKVKKKIVADGLRDETFDTTNVGTHLSPAEFNAAIDDPETIVVDMRNRYETEVGKFEKAITPDVDTFRDELPLVAEMLADQKEKRILMYCTGGVRCEKASAYFKHLGFKNVNQLAGGIISYAHAVKEQNLPSKFHGKNFVFDERLGERITNEIISSCYFCGKKSDRQQNCANEMCHALMIQCEECAQALEGCCSEECRHIIKLPAEERREMRKKDDAQRTKRWYSKKIRPLALG